MRKSVLNCLCHSWLTPSINAPNERARSFCGVVGAVVVVVVVAVVDAETTDIPSGSVVSTTVGGVSGR